MTLTGLFDQLHHFKLHGNDVFDSLVTSACRASAFTKTGRQGKEKKDDQKECRADKGFISDHNLSTFFNRHTDPMQCFEFNHGNAGLYLIFIPRTIKIRETGINGLKWKFWHTAWTR